MKQETFYVQITGCNTERSWYKNHIGRYFLVYSKWSEDLHETAYIVVGDEESCFIMPEDCRRVYLQEQATDIDGKPLDCGDDVFNTSGHVTCKLKYLYFCNPVYWCENMQGYRIGYDSIRKVKPDPVDPIEELYKNYQGKIDYLASGKYSATTPYEFEVSRDFAIAIKKYIEDKIK